jgi:hypothetical protein
MRHVATTATSSSSSPSSLSTIPAAASVGKSATPGGAAMSISRTLKAYLDRERVHYDVLPHMDAFRAAETAHTLHTPEKEIAKVVIVKIRELKRGHSTLPK